LSPESFSALSEFGTKTSLRYAMQVLTLSQLLATKYNASTVRPIDLQRAYWLLEYRAKCVERSQRSERKSVTCNECEDGRREMNQNDDAVPMQDVEA
jgi:DNA helicase TIP49 (TBP-interacting protein)